MTDIDPTPQNPPTIPDRLGWWRGEMRATLAALAGPEQTSLYDLATALTWVKQGIIDEGALTRGAMVEEEGNNIAAVCRKLDALLVDTSVLREQMRAIEETLGAGPYSSTETGNIRALLMLLATCCGTTGITPDSDGRQPVYSYGTVTLNGRRYATWTGGAIATASGGGRYLTPTQSWDGLQVYVQTDAPSVTMEDTTTPAATVSGFPANSWIDLGGTDTLGWYVDSRYNIRAYLRGESTGIVLHSFGAHQNSGNLDLQFVTLPGFTLTDTSNPNSWSLPVMHMSQAPGYKLKQLTGGTVMITYWYWDSWRGNAYLSIGSEVAIGGYSYDRFYVHSEGNNTPFTVQLITP